MLTALGERDETAEICRDQRREPEPDPELRDTESVPLKESIARRTSSARCCRTCPDAWIDESKTKVGYEIPLNRHFYRYEPPRPLEVIEADIKALEIDILSLVERLRAQRIALISRAVTRGLPPDAARAAGLDPCPVRRSSGFGWLDAVPEHWEVLRLKYVASINDETLSESTPADLEIMYVDISSVDGLRGITSVEPMLFEDAPSRARRIVRDGDTIISTVRTYLRAIAPIRDPHSNLIVSTGFAVVRPRNVDPDYLSYALRESGFIDSIVARSVGVSYPAVIAAEIGAIPIPLPPPSEQRAIAVFLDQETTRIDEMAAKIDAAVQRLQEYRTALITAAVTGTIDMRGVKAWPTTSR